MLAEPLVRGVVLLFLVVLNVAFHFEDSVYYSSHSSRGMGLFVTYTGQNNNCKPQTNKQTKKEKYIVLAQGFVFSKVKHLAFKQFKT